MELAISGPPLSKQEAAQFVAQLPTRQGDETLGDRIRRAARNQRIASSNVIYINFRPLIAIQRLAADSGEVAPLPDPGRPLKSADGRFRLWITAVSGMLQLTIEALGFASEEFAGRRLALAAAGAWSEQAMEQNVQLRRDAVIAEWTLNEDGDGECKIPDSLETRQALLRPVIGLVEDNE
ncbi:MAG: hypothetical protein H6969_06720 [Gammaproteobacteria bacterium]|nr:hypothetical protein [Gammaproteobacteria bacterium]